AGLREIEVGSFVSPQRLPQMADTAEIVQAAGNIPGLTVQALVPNLKGAERAVAGGAPKLAVPGFAPPPPRPANVGMAPEEALAQVGQICEVRSACPAERRRGIEATVATAFGCTIEGPVDEDWVLTLARRLAATGVDSVGLADTTGYANPAQVK